MRENFEFGFTSVFNIDCGDHYAMSSKDRTSLFDDMPLIITHETGELLLDWLNSRKNFYKGMDQMAELDSLIAQIYMNTQTKVKVKYPDFENERVS